MIHRSPAWIASRPLLGRAGTSRRHLLLCIACVAVLCGILVAGLWPFHSPRNEVTWLQDQNGLRFGDYGTVMSTGAFRETGSRDEASCTIELWLHAALPSNGGTILTLFAPDNPLQFSLYQSLTDLMLQSGRSSSPNRARKQRVYVSDVFRQGQPLFVTIASGSEGTSVYVNGTLSTNARHFQLMPRGCAGRLIVGDSPRQQDSWSGRVKGLAIYDSELTAPAVLLHYTAWTRNGRPEVDRNEHVVGLYLFDERAGDIVHNHARPGIDLFIPRTYTVLDKIFLEPFWDEFDMSWGYWKNILKNIAGFVPLGLCFCAYLTLVRKYKRAALVTIILGSAVSLTIEVLQGYLPTRDSGTTDLITNTLGTWIGVMLYNAARAQWDLYRRWGQEPRNDGQARTHTDGTA
jgi:hypothetical protein